MTPFIVSGFVVGSIYAISALGLVLTYTSSRVFNFAHGAIAFAMAVLHYYFVHYEHWDLWLSAGFILFVVAPLVGLFLWAVLFRFLTHVSPTVRLVSTIGLWVAIPSLVYIVFPWVKGEIYQPPGLVHRPLGIHHVLGIVINDDQGAVLVAAILIAIGATLLMRLTPLGLAIRATVDHPRNATIAGINTDGATALSWMIGIMLAALAGILLAPIQQGFNLGVFTLLLVASFGAAVVGKIRSLPLTFAGAMLIGLIQGIWPNIYTDHVKNSFAGDFLSKGVSASIPFVVMIVFLLCYKDLRSEAFTVDLRSSQGTRRELPPLPPAHGWRRAAGPLAIAVVAITVPFWLSDVWLVPLTQGLALSIIYLSFTMVTGEGGLISLCHITLAGLGGFAAAMLATNSGWPVWLAILAGACIAVPCGLLVALPSLRIGDLYFALLTLGGAMLVENFVFIKDQFDNIGAGVVLPRPFGLDAISSHDRAIMYFIVAAVFAVPALLVVNLKRSTTGMGLAAMRSGEPAALTVGISTVKAKLLMFAASAFVAGLGGAMFSSVVGRATAGSFSVLVGIVYLAVVVTWGVRSVLGALMAGVIFGLLQERLILLLIFLIVTIVAGFIVQMFLSKRYKRPLGVVTMLVVTAIGVTVIELLWSVKGGDVQAQNIWAAHALLLGVWVGPMIGGLVFLIQKHKLHRRPLGIVALAADIAVLIAGIVVVVTANLNDSALDVPTMLFGLGAVFLARQPRGVIYDMVNRQRLILLRDQERRREVELAKATAEVGA